MLVRPVRSIAAGQAARMAAASGASAALPITTGASPRAGEHGGERAVAIGAGQRLRGRVGAAPGTSSA